MDFKEIKRIADKHIAPTYKDRPIALARGRNSYVFDVNGKKYLDFVSGVGVTNLGHARKSLIEAATRQMKKLVHASNFFHTEPQSLYARELTKAVGGKGRVFFCNSGAEANEGAIKFARLHQSAISPGRTDLISFKGSFHGRTFGALTLTGQKVFHEGFKPLLPGVKYAEYGSIGSVERLMTKKVAAVIVEPIQGEIGIITPPPKFLGELAGLCRKSGALLIVDEVMTGFSRTGRLFAFEHSKIKPDIISMGKGIANGMPMGAVWASEEIARSLSPGSHGTTYGGGPVVCATALAALKELNDPELLESVRSLGRYMLLRLTGMKASNTMVRQARGLGLMIGVELDRSALEIAAKLAERGLLVIPRSDNIIRLLPPLTISRAEIEKALNILEKALALK